MSRLLTRSGDQAWDFAVPLVLVSILPEGIKVAALYYLALRLGQALLAPWVGAMIDKWSRLAAIRIGITAQVAFTLVGAAVILGGEPGGAGWLVLLGVAGLGASLGALATEIGVASDLIPALIPPAELPAVNSRLKQVDLGTEVGAPILAGLLLTVSAAAFPRLGFALIALWNVASFVPEYRLLSGVVTENREALAKKAVVAPRVTLWRKLTDGWRAFFRQPVMPAMLAYALLWLSVLSPHGILLAAFLKDAWAVPEPAIGLFRGLGAVLGLLATYAFPPLARRLGVVAASRAFLVFQAVMVSVALFAFRAGSAAQLLFFAAILLSRVGLYGFSIGEAQIRQIGIAEAERGRVNGFAAALTSLATLGLYGAGAALPRTDDFGLLVAGSAAAVMIAVATFFLWSCGKRAADL